MGLGLWFSLLIDPHFRKAWMPHFWREGHPVVTPQAFLDFVGNHLHGEAFLEMPLLSGEELHDAAMAKKTTAGGLDGGLGMRIRHYSYIGLGGLALFLRQIESASKWHQGLLDAYMAMVPKVEGDGGCRLWASVRLAHLQDWFYSWVPDSVLYAGKGVSSVDAWYSTTLDIEEILSNARQGDFHIFVADVVKSFDTVDRDILDCALVERLGLPERFRRVYFFPQRRSSSI